MTLKEQLKKRADGTKQKLAADKHAIMNNATMALVDMDFSKMTLRTGDSVKDFTLTNAINNEITLSEILKNKMVVLTFYRGGWCPYCNMALRALEAVLPEIVSNGASLVAISPELPNKSLSTIEKNELSFEVLSDVDNTVAKNFNLVFSMPKDLQALYKDEWNIRVDEHNGNEDYELPLAATYIINKSHEIIYHFVTERYTERAEPIDIITVLEKENKK